MGEIMIKNNNINKFINWTPALVWMYVIFMFSSQPASQSNELSVGFTRLLVETLGNLLPFNIETSAISSFVAQLNHIVRKLAHFSVYLVLGVLVSRALVKNGFKGRVFLISFLICSTYAVTDELHQLFVPGRGCQIKDVFIDSLGAFVGILLNKIDYLLRVFFLHSSYK